MKGQTRIEQRRNFQRPLSVAGGYFFCAVLWLLFLGDSGFLFTGSDSAAAFPVSLKTWISVVISTVIVAVLAHLHYRSDNERRKLIKHLEVQNQKFELISANSSDLIALLDKDCRFVYLSPSFETVLGYKPADLIGIQIEELIHPRDQQVLRNVKDPELFQVRMLSQSGEWYWIEGSRSWGVLEDNEYLICICRDISNRKHMEFALRREMLFADSAMNSLPGVFFMFDESLRCIRWNDNLKKLTGYSTEELASLSSLKLFGGEKQRYEDAVAQVFSEGWAALEGTLRTKDSGEIPYFFTCHLFVTEGCRYLLGTGIDISYLHRAESILNQSEDRFKNIFEQSPQGIMIIDTNLVVINTNDALASMLEFDIGGLVGKPLESLMHADDFAEIRPYLEAMFTGGRVQNSFEHRWLTTSGKEIWVRLKPAVVSGAYDSANGLLMLENITERKQYERRLEIYMARLKKLSHRQLEIQEAERRHISRELHDEVGQALMAVKLYLKNALNSARKDVRLRHMREAMTSVEGVMEQVRELSRDLRPSMLDDFGLDEAMRWFIERQEIATLNRIEFRYSSNVADRRLGQEIETVCFRVAQEAINNIIKHAEAGKVWISLNMYKRHLELKIVDDGLGFDVRFAKRDAIRGRSFGLLGMEER
ncbi:MAG: PAS domain S-box protein, partial [Gammaproteobacteria bacterium]|nr:PAS domain S-box protein [Gammaproteobacteria bacterium]